MLGIACQVIADGGYVESDGLLIDKLRRCLRDAQGHVQAAHAAAEPSVAAGEAASAALCAGVAWRAFDDWQADRIVPAASAIAITLAEGIAQQAAEVAKELSNCGTWSASLAADLAEMEVIHCYWKAGLTP